MPASRLPHCARSADRTTSPPPARIRTPQVTGAVVRAGRSGTSSVFSRPADTAGARAGAGRYRPRRPEPRGSGPDRRRRSTALHHATDMAPSTSLSYTRPRKVADRAERSGRRTDGSPPAILAPEIQDRKRFGSADDPCVRAAALRTNLALGAWDFGDGAPAFRAPLGLRFTHGGTLHHSGIGGGLHVQFRTGGDRQPGRRLRARAREVRQPR